MTQVHFTLTKEEIESLIANGIKDEGLKIILTKVFNTAMLAERDAYIQANNYERCDERISQRNGFYTREYVTIANQLTLKVPRTRDGKFETTVFNRYERRERALVLAILEMYVNGVSTRKVSSIVKSLNGTTVSKSLVSSLTKELDLEVEAWRNRSLSDKEYAVVYADVLFIKVREENRVVSKSCHIAIGVTTEGYREILGMMILDGENRANWVYFFTSLINRGLKDIPLIVSDAHKGLVQAVTECFVGASWQRCQVHFLRNLIQAIPRKNSILFRQELKNLFNFTDIEHARKALHQLLDAYANNPVYKKACELLEEGFDDAFQYACVFSVGSNRLRSTNVLERLNEEIRRREKVVRIFPNTASAIRLIGAILMDTQSKWDGTKKKYINFN